MYFKPEKPASAECLACAACPFYRYSKQALRPLDQKKDTVRESKAAQPSFTPLHKEWNLEAWATKNGAKCPSVAVIVTLRESK